MGRHTVSGGGRLPWADDARPIPKDALKSLGKARAQAEGAGPGWKQRAISGRPNAAAPKAWERVRDHLAEQGRSPWEVRLPAHFREIGEALCLHPGTVESAVERLRGEMPRPQRAAEKREEQDDVTNRERVERWLRERGIVPRPGTTVAMDIQREMMRDLDLSKGAVTGAISWLRHSPGAPAPSPEPAVTAAVELAPAPEGSRVLVEEPSDGTYPDGGHLPSGELAPTGEPSEADALRRENARLAVAINQSRDELHQTKVALDASEADLKRYRHMAEQRFNVLERIIAAAGLQPGIAHSAIAGEVQKLAEEARDSATLVAGLRASNEHAAERMGQLQAELDETRGACEILRAQAAEAEARPAEIVPVPEPLPARPTPPPLTPEQAQNALLLSAGLTDRLHAFERAPLEARSHS